VGKLRAKKLSGTWAMRFDLRDVHALGHVRLVPSLEVAEHDGRVWLRGQNAVLERIEIRALPAVERFNVFDQDQLIPAGALVPRKRMPTADWVPIGQWLQVIVPAPSMAGQLTQGVQINLVRGGDCTQANALVTDWPTWMAYALTAPRVRLAHWSFALDQTGRVLIRGVPLVPLPGDALVIDHNIARPLGWRFAPDIPSSLVARLFDLKDGDLVLFDADQRATRIAGDAFVQATRSSIRQTAEGQSHG
jgi:hypothetical protein